MSVTFTTTKNNPICVFFKIESMPIKQQCKQILYEFYIIFLWILYYFFQIIPTINTTSLKRQKNEAQRKILTRKTTTTTTTTKSWIQLTDTKLCTFLYTPQMFDSFSLRSVILLITSGDSRCRHQCTRDSDARNIVATVLLSSPSAIVINKIWASLYLVLPPNHQTLQLWVERPKHYRGVQILSYLKISVL